MSYAKTMSTILGQASWRRVRRVFILAAGASIIETLGIALMVPVLSMSFGQTTHMWGVPVSMPQPVIIALLALLYCLGLLLRILAINKTATTCMREGYALSARMFGLFLAQPYQWHLQNNSADLRAKLLNDVQEFIGLFLVPLGRLASQVSLVLCVLLVLLIVRPLETSVVAMVLGAGYLVVFTLVKPRLDKSAKLQHLAHARRQRISTEAFSSIRDVMLLKLERKCTDDFRDVSSTIAQATSQRSVYTEMPKVILEACLFLVLVLVLSIYLAQPNKSGAEAIPELLLFLAAGLKLFPMGHLIYVNLANLRSGQVFATALSDTIGDVPQPEPGVAFPRMKSEMVIKDVCFTYPEGRNPVLKNVSFTAKCGDTIAITGPSGSGKSTLIDIISGLVSPTSGQVLIDGNALGSGNARSWQDQISYCPQTPSLFDDSIQANVSAGAQTHDDRVRKACEVAGLSPFLESLGENALTDPIGEMGRRLSGGQRQRISIARALYRDVPVYIFDEPTNNLDTKTALTVMHDILQYKSHALVFIVTHDPEVAKKCDFEIGFRSPS